MLSGADMRGKGPVYVFREAGVELRSTAAVQLDDVVREFVRSQSPAPPSEPGGLANGAPGAIGVTSSMASEPNEQEVVSRTTAAEHESLTHAMSALEQALVAPYPGRESEWKRRVATAAATVAEEVRRHVESAESDDGLLPQVEIRIGHGHDVTLARCAHRDLAQETEGLIRDLPERADDPALTVPRIRERALQLMTDLRRHRALEADLILTVFDRDIGAGE